MRVLRGERIPTHEDSAGRRHRLSTRRRADPECRRSGLGERGHGLCYLSDAEERRSWGDRHAAPDESETGNRALSGSRFGWTGGAHIGVQSRHYPVGGSGVATYESRGDGRNRDASDDDYGRGRASTPEGSSHSVRGGAAGLSGQPNRDALPQSGRGHGNVPGRRTGGDDSVDRAMAEPDVHALHSDTSPTDDERRGRRHDREPRFLYN